MQLLVAQLNPTVGDLSGNGAKITHAITQGKAQGCELILFSELSLCGYPPDDLLLYRSFVDAMEKQLHHCVKATKGTAAIIGTARYGKGSEGNRLYNSAAICIDGEVIGYHDKWLLPTYDVFDEERYFQPGRQCKVWEIGGKRVGITICEDLWFGREAENLRQYIQDPVEQLKDEAIDLLVNISASPFSKDKLQKRHAVAAAASCKVGAPVIFCNQVGANDSLIFDGHSFLTSKEGSLVAQAAGFHEEQWIVDVDSHSASCSSKQQSPDPMEQLHQALVLGIRDYFHKQGFKKACLGLSGGIDSALVAALAVEALGKEAVLGVAMPSRYSSEGSIADMKALATNLGMQTRTLPIETPFATYLDLLQDELKGGTAGITEENLQARIRGMILMALSNSEGYIVLSTGNKSEMAMGYCTLYGDMAGGLGVISDLLKSEVYALSRWINREKEVIPWNSIEKPPSAELRPDQKDSDTLPEYFLIDQVLKQYVEEYRSPEEIAQNSGFDLALVRELVKKIHRTEYKRRQAPPGLRVTEKAFSIGRRLPIVQKWVS